MVNDETFIDQIILQHDNRQTSQPNYHNFKECLMNFSVQYILYEDQVKFTAKAKWGPLPNTCTLYGND